MYDSWEAIAYYEDVAALNAAHGVYTVRDIETGRIYIKKVMHVYSLAVYSHLLEHPVRGIPRIYALYEHAGTLTVIEEYIAGDTLQSVLDRGGAFTELAVTNYASQLCKILAALHSLNPPIVHRDIKPSNIILTEDDRVVLIDLNAARMDDEESDRDTRLLGTSGYAAPEQYGFGKSSTTADIYALGILMQVMLTGGEYAPISGNSQMDARALTREELSCSPRLARIIRKCTQLDPGKRYRSADALAKALRKRPATMRIVAVALLACTVLGITAAGMQYMWNLFGEDTSLETRITGGDSGGQVAESLADLVGARSSSTATNTERTTAMDSAGAVDPALVGVYKGDMNDVLVLWENGLADYYIDDDEYTELSLPWSVTDGMLEITFPKLHCTVTADVSDTTDEIYLVSNDMGWTDEGFQRSYQTPDEYGHPAVVCADSNTIMNADGYLICTLGGLQFTIPRQYIDAENSFDDRDDASGYWSVKYHRYYEADLIIGVDTESDATVAPDQAAVTRLDYAADYLEIVSYEAGFAYRVAGYDAWLSPFTATSATDRDVIGTLVVIYQADAGRYLYALFLGDSGAYEAEIGDFLDMLDTAVRVEAET